MKIFLYILTYLLEISVFATPKEGLSFVVVGDFGNMEELERPKMVFDAIAQMKSESEKGTAEDFDFFVTTGDNIYPSNPEFPTDAEFESMMNLFIEREPIKDLPIYPVRGNHDCYIKNQ